MIEFKEIEGKPDSNTIKEIEAFYFSIFGNAELDKFEKRISEAVNPFTVLALQQDKIVGFKIGYQIAPKTFYSWIGGVAESFRQQGIAAELIKRQHAWCAANGFETMQTKTQNRFKSMLILNLKSGFDVIEVYRDEQNELKIVLEKNLL